MKIFLLLIAMLSFSCLYSQNQENGRKDSDGDGVVDVRDVDDDNDGILDIDENKRDFSMLKQWINRVNVNTSSNNVLFQKGVPGWKNGAASIKFSELGFDQDYDLTFRARDAQTAVVGFGITDTSQELEDVDYGLYFENNKFRIVNSGEFQTNPKPYKDVDNFKISYRGEEILFYHEEELVYTQIIERGLDFQLDISFFGSPEGFGHGDLKDFTLAFSFSDMDLDNDGIINSLDLDSDGDGCFDVVEAGFSDPDGDGILGEGTPSVNSDGMIISEIGYGCQNGEINCQEISFNFLNPNFNSCDINNYGLTINTTLMPSSLFDVTYGEEIFQNQKAGTEESNLKIETEESVLNEIFLKVHKFENRKELNLKIEQAVDSSIKIFVDVQGEWKPFSRDFYRLDNNTIIIRPGSIPDVIYPFKLNLVNGVFYDRSAPLQMIVEGDLDLTNSSMVITGPDQVAYTLAANGNQFNWDGALASSGNYQFTIIIQEKVFTGQFIISNQ